MVSATQSAPTITLPASAVVHHSLRPEWGAAVFVWDRSDKRAYQFEDGQVRIFKHSFLHLLHPVSGGDVPDDEALRQLRQVALMIAGSQAPGDSSRRRDGTVVTFSEQLRRLASDYPDGFSSADWSSHVRGTDSERRLKRHRDAAVEEAQQQLDEEVLRKFLSEQKYDEIKQRAQQVMRGTDMISPKQAQPIERLDGDRCRNFAEALVELLHGDDAIDVRLDRYLRAVGAKDSSWQLATVLLALVHPQEHVCVRPAAFRNQAKWTQPEIRYQSKPTGLLYVSWQLLALRVRKLLEDAGQKPRDLLDVYDFIHMTAKS